MTPSLIKDFVKKVDNPLLNSVTSKVVIQVWNDGSISCQKGGKLLWKRNMHCLRKAHQSNSIEMPHEFRNGYSYAFVTFDNAIKISDMIYNL